VLGEDFQERLPSLVYRTIGGLFFSSGRRCFGEIRALLMAFDLRETNPPLPHSALWARHRELDLDSILLDSAMVV
jgi:hypothetical protein